MNDFFRSQTFLFVTMLLIFSEINYYKTTKRLKEIEAKCDELLIKIKECES